MTNLNKYGEVNIKELIAMQGTESGLNESPPWHHDGHAHTAPLV